MLPDCLPWLGVLGEWTNPLWLGVCKRLSQHLQWTQCHIERLCIRDYCRTQHFDWPDLWNMSGKIAVGGGIPKAIPTRSSAALPALSLNVSLEVQNPLAKNTASAFHVHPASKRL